MVVEDRNLISSIRAYHTSLNGPPKVCARHQLHMPTSTTSPDVTNALNRLLNIKGHMDGRNPTVFDKDNVPLAPEDPLFGLMAAYRKDDFEKKVDLGIGAYRDDSAKPWVLPVVKTVCNTLEGAVCSTCNICLCNIQADDKLRKDPNLNHEYLPIAGLVEFTSAAQKLILGADSPAIKEQRVCFVSNGPSSQADEFGCRSNLSRQCQVPVPFI